MGGAILSSLIGRGGLQTTNMFRHVPFYYIVPTSKELLVLQACARFMSSNASANRVNRAEYSQETQPAAVARPGRHQACRVFFLASLITAPIVVRRIKYIWLGVQVVPCAILRTFELPHLDFGACGYHNK